MTRLLKCLRCWGTGWRTPPPRARGDFCPACDGAGEVAPEHPWAAYEFTLDFCRGGNRVSVTGAIPMSRPRIRTLKPELWQDEKIGNLSRDARLLFIGLVTMADDEGRLRALPALILGHVFPYDTDALRKLEQWLEEIAHSGLVVGIRLVGRRM